MAILAVLAAYSTVRIEKGPTASAAKGPSAPFACGKTKVFLRKDTLETLELKRANTRQRAARTLQARARQLQKPILYVLQQPIETGVGMDDPFGLACSSTSSVSGLGPASLPNSLVRASRGVVRSNLARSSRV